MHSASQVMPITIGVTVLKKSGDLVILGETFYPMMTFEKHLRSISIGAFHRLGILGKSWRVLHDRFLLGRCFRCLSCQFWSSVLQCSARLKMLKILMRLLAAELLSTAWILFPFQCHCGTILPTPVFDGLGVAGFKGMASAFSLA